MRYALAAFAAVTLAVMFASDADAGEKCNTTHTSDLRGVWQCGNTCVYRHGNLDVYRQGHLVEGIGARVLTIDGTTDFVRFELKGNVATLNGKRCKWLEQTFDYGPRVD
jgi:hypothetical protein